MESKITADWETIMTVAETIREITKKHLQSGGVALGQCLTAVGWVGGTVPELTEQDGLIELSMDDTAGGGIAVGLALAGRRPIYIVRYQGFQWFNAAMIVNYAAKSKDMWGIPCPVFVRSVAMEGSIGPVASSSHHGMFTRMPGIEVVAPMTPAEYASTWKYFMSHDVPIYVSEHRKSFPIDYELPNIIRPKADITLFPISVGRLNALEAVKELEKEGIMCNLIHIVRLKPFVPSNHMLKALADSIHGGIVIDTDFENGVSKCIAHDMMLASDKKVHTLGLKERAAGFAPHLDNLPPSPKEIIRKVKELIKDNRR